MTEYRWQTSGLSVNRRLILSSAENAHTQFQVFFKFSDVLDLGVKVIQSLESGFLLYSFSSQTF